MEREIIIPDNVKIEIDGKRVKISGKNGELEKEFKHFFDIKIGKKDNKIVVNSTSDRRKVKAMIGTIVAHIGNMIKGVTEDFSCKLRVLYSHFPVTVKVEGDKVMIHNFLGETRPRSAQIIGNTKVNIQGQDIILTGPNKEDVGQTCGNIEQACRISKFDRRVFMDGIYKIMEE